MLRVFLVFLSLRLFFPLSAALACPSFAQPHRVMCPMIGERGDRSSVSVAGKGLAPRSLWPSHRGCLQLIDADLYDGTAGWGGEVLFHFAPIVFFSPYSILLGVVHSHCVQLHKRGVGALCAVFRGRIGPSTNPRTMPARPTESVSARRQKTRGATARKRGAFRTVLRIRLREASTPRVVEPCRRRAREETERHGRERDKCRAKT